MTQSDFESVNPNEHQSRRGVNRLTDRRIWPQKADSRISKIQRIADQL